MVCHLDLYLLNDFSEHRYIVYNLKMTMGQKITIKNQIIIRRIAYYTMPKRKKTKTNDKHQYSFTITLQNITQETKA